MFYITNLPIKIFGLKVPGEISKILPLEFWHSVEVFVHAFDHFDSLLPRSYQSKAQVHIRTDFSFHAKPLVILRSSKVKYTVT